MIKKFKSVYRGKKKYLIDFVLIVIVFISVRQYQTQDIVTGQALAVDGILLDNTKIDWQSYQGKPLLIHFWASWCKICRLEEDSIQAIAKDYQVLSIASWSDDTVSYMQQRGLHYPTLNDIEGKWAERYGIKAVPSSIIIDKDGYISFIETGFTSETGLRLRLWWLQL